MSNVWRAQRKMPGRSLVIHCGLVLLIGLPSIRFQALSERSMSNEATQEDQQHVDSNRTSRLNESWLAVNPIPISLRSPPVNMRTW